ncbi:Nif3-like dinuclear metal center hexameric protein [Lentibacillus amyloliquefaciens]|uniref:GTP cyclohydrolase 1 type 2 homolog n=1 Tax=Lentibacillus amyloliquefaciens TaxID=1472767 RepID=A0A0U4EC18_9BACI|nr:Nif3-like dinuclear metal center hexameric protein [Lentibacillus amyloliquefaciens]ALX48105.1 Nif3-like dinuclear metal center hexameric protein [Lentibacillus amyloliquefaciens]
MAAVTHNADVFKAMETWAPKYLAYDWDNVGLQIGSFQKPVKNILISLDVLEATVNEAIENNVDLIIVHHPLFFKSIKQINMDTAKGRIIQKLIQHDISVYAAHTNFDAANGGMNDIMCHLLGIQNADVLDKNYTERLVKIAVFVPRTHADEVRDAMSRNGAGHIGDYSHCTFQSQGQGTFKPLEGSDPYIGNQGELEFVDEVKIETIIPAAKMTPVIDAMIDAHPYEEAAYDVYPVENSGEVYGVGRIGTLDEELALKTLCERVKKELNVQNIRVTGDLDRKVKTVAVLGGSGEKYINKAKHMGADVYITGDMTFHTAQDAREMGLSVIDPGHYAEKVMISYTKSFLDNYFAEDLNILVSQTNTDPFQFI